MCGDGVELSDVVAAGREGGGAGSCQSRPISRQTATLATTGHTRGASYWLSGARYHLKIGWRHSVPTRRGAGWPLAPGSDKMIFHSHTWGPFAATLLRASNRAPALFARWNDAVGCTAGGAESQEQGIRVGRRWGWGNVRFTSPKRPVFVGGEVRCPQTGELRSRTANQTEEYGTMPRGRPGVALKPRAIQRGKKRPANRNPKIGI